jgi:hypothetical protein
MAEETIVEQRGARSAGDILQDVVQDLGNIVRSEIELAKTEISEKAAKAGKGAGLMGAAGVAGLLAGAAVVTCCIAALAIAIPVWAAALIMAFLLAAAGGALFFAGRGKIKHIQPVPEKTARTLREDLQWARQHTR